MIDRLADQVVRLIPQANELYERLVMLVAPSGAGKTAVLDIVHQRTGAPLVNVNLELSRKLLELTTRQRPLKASGLFAEILRDTGESVLLLDNIELLFDKTLKIDPLRLLQGLSRETTLIVAWGGSIEDGDMIYGAPNHPEYHRYPVRNLLVVTPAVE